MAYIVMALYIVIACIVMACIVMACIVMACIVMAPFLTVSMGASAEWCAARASRMSVAYACTHVCAHAGYTIEREALCRTRWGR